jgi:hypothetical protein
MFTTKKRLLGIPVLALTLIIALVGCIEDGGENVDEGNKDPKTITITGIDAGSYADIKVVNQAFEQVASGSGPNSSGTATLTLMDNNFTPWTGNGSYYLTLMVDTTQYMYTDGKGWDDFEITEGMDEDEIMAKLPKYNISTANSTITFTKFKKLDELTLEEDDDDEPSEDDDDE